MIAEIQVAPKPSGTEDNEYAFVNAAIAILKESGLHHEIGALGTTFEGDADIAWTVIRRMVEKTLASGADSALPHMKIAYIAPDMSSLMSKFR